MSFSDKQLVFGGAPPGSPWGTMGAVVARALEPLGYSVRIETEASMGRCPGLVQAGTLEFGANQTMTTRWAHLGIKSYAQSGAMPRLRTLATIMMPAWIGIAARWENGITDLAQIRERQYPVRVLGGGREVFQQIWAHYGLSRELIESWGGVFLESPRRAPGSGWAMAPWVRTGEFDIIMDPLYAANTIEACYWHEASVLYNLRFLELPEELVTRMCADLGAGAYPGSIPFRLVRGVDRPIRTIYRPLQGFLARDDMPDEFAYLFARALDDGRALLRQTHIPFSYDERTVAMDVGVALHPGAERYYREMGYPISTPTPAV
ncbi:MAG: hypothetical protein JOZ65_20815 [Chloroflexi bacterium]|nr:hypothetical protein [Chloroflexota bacterium]